MDSGESGSRLWVSQKYKDILLSVEDVKDTGRSVQSCVYVSSFVSTLASLSLIHI